MRKVVLVACDIRSTHNVGSFFRSADGFGASVVLAGITPRPAGGTNDSRLPYVTKKAHKAISKTALGAEESVSWEYFESSDKAIENLKNRGYFIAAIEQAENSKPIDQMGTEQDIALLVGPEVDGLSEEILDLCDEIYEIPMAGNKESFNVSVAAGIALYQASL